MKSRDELIDQLQIENIKLKAENQSHGDKCCKMALENNDLNFEIIKLQKQNEIMREALEQIDSHQNCKDSFEICKKALARITKDEG